jgi:hypothetical protein
MNRTTRLMKPAGASEADWSDRDGVNERLWPPLPAAIVPG